MAKAVKKEAEFKFYRRIGLSEMRLYVSGESMDGISISDEDKNLETLDGGYIARNPKNHNDKWYVAKKYFDDNLEEALPTTNDFEVKDSEIVTKAKYKPTFGELAVKEVFQNTDNELVNGIDANLARIIDTLKAVKDQNSLDEVSSKQIDTFIEGAINLDNKITRLLLSLGDTISVDLFKIYEVEEEKEE